MTGPVAGALGSWVPDFRRDPVSGSAAACSPEPGARSADDLDVVNRRWERPGPAITSSIWAARRQPFR
jgi:hypothetical protein